MTLHTQESINALKAIHWYVENIYGQDINLSNRNTVKEHFKFVKEHNDMTLETYWNDFAQRHNRSVETQEMLPFINHKNSV